MPSIKQIMLVYVLVLYGITAQTNSKFLVSEQQEDLLQASDRYSYWLTSTQTLEAGKDYFIPKDTEIRVEKSEINVGRLLVLGKLIINVDKDK